MCFRLTRPPDYILMENVKGFETSDTREHFVETLKFCGYTYQEFLLSPTQFGIPNSRLRYYLLAKKKPLQFCFSTRDEMMNSLPCCSVPENYGPSSFSGRRYNCTLSPGSKTNETTAVNQERLSVVEANRDSTHREEDPICLNCLQRRTKTNSSLGDSLNGSVSESCKLTNCGRIVDYLEKNKDDNYFEEFLLPQKVLSKFALVLDIVTTYSERSCCFTKAYGHYAEGTGSVLKMADIDDTKIFNKYRNLTDDRHKSEVLSVLRLRYFTPREVANLHGFPKEFCFPPTVSIKQQYRLLGNSLNVHVVSELMNCLFQSPA